MSSLYAGNRPSIVSDYAPIILLYSICNSDDTEVLLKPIHAKISGLCVTRNVLSFVTETKF